MAEFIYPELITVQVVRCQDCTAAMEHDDTHVMCTKLRCMKSRKGFCDEGKPRPRRLPFISPTYDEEELV